MLHWEVESSSHWTNCRRAETTRRLLKDCRKVRSTWVHGFYSYHQAGPAAVSLPMTLYTTYSRRYHFQWYMHAWFSSFKCHFLVSVLVLGWQFSISFSYSLAITFVLIFVIVLMSFQFQFWPEFCNLQYSRHWYVRVSNDAVWMRVIGERSNQLGNCDLRLAVCGQCCRPQLSADWYNISWRRRQCTQRQLHKCEAWLCRHCCLRDCLQSISHKII